MAGPILPSNTQAFVCDWMPYRRSNARFRTLEAVSPEDWGAGLFNLCDDARRYAEIPAGVQSTWSAQAEFTGFNVTWDIVAAFLFAPGGYGTTGLAVNGNTTLRINVASGQLQVDSGGGFSNLVALPPSIWRSASDFESAWIRIHAAGNGTFRVRLWPMTGAEPDAWLWSNFVAGAGMEFVSARIGCAGSSLGACAWYAIGPLVTGALGVAPRLAVNPQYFNEWLKDAHTGLADRVLACEIWHPGWNGTNASAYTTAVVRLATQAYASGDAWPFSNQPFAEGVVAWPEFAQEIDPALPFGRLAISESALVVASPGGARRDLIRRKLQGATITMRYGDPAWPWWDLRPVFTGEVTDVAEVDWQGVSAVEIRLRDLHRRYDRALQPRTLVTTHAENGKPIPWLSGDCFNVAPTQIDAATLTYQFADGAVDAVTEVRDRGVPLSDAQVPFTRYVAATNTVRWTGHGAVAGLKVRVSNNNCQPLVSGTDYYVLPAGLTADDVRLSASPGGSEIAILGNPQSIAGWHTASDWLEAFSTITGLSVGDRVHFTSLGGLSDLTAGTDYFVHSISGRLLKVAATSGGPAIDLTAGAVSTVSSVDTSLDRLVTSAAHGLAVNDVVSIQSTGALPAPLSTDTVVVVNTVPTTTAITVRPLLGGPMIDLTSAGSGTITIRKVNEVIMHKPVPSGPALIRPLWRGDDKIVLGANPAGQITCDVRRRASGQNTLSRIATDAISAAGLPVNPLVSRDLRLNQAGAVNFAWQGGLHVTEPRNLLDILDETARSALSTWWVDARGTLRAWVMTLAIPAASLLKVTPDMLRSRPGIRAARKIMPTARYEGASALYRPNFTVQRPADLAGSVTPENVARYGAEGTIIVRNAGGSGPVADLNGADKGPTQRRPRFDTLWVGDQTGGMTGLFGNGVFANDWQLVVFELDMLWIEEEAVFVGRGLDLGDWAGDYSLPTPFTALVTGVRRRLAEGALTVTALAAIDGQYDVTS